MYGVPVDFSVQDTYRTGGDKKILQTELILLVNLRDMQCRNRLLEETPSVL